MKFSVPADLLRRILAGASKAAGRDPSLPGLCGVWINAAKEGGGRSRVDIVAADGCWLFCWRSGPLLDVLYPGGRKEWFLPAAALAVLAAALKEACGNVDVDLDTGVFAGTPLCCRESFLPRYLEVLASAGNAGEAGPPAVGFDMAILASVAAGFRAACGLGPRVQCPAEWLFGAGPRDPVLVKALSPAADGDLCAAIAPMGLQETGRATTWTQLS